MNYAFLGRIVYVGDGRRFLEGANLTTSVMTTRMQLIVGGRIIDGTGNPWFYGDVVIDGDSITRIAPAGSVSRPDVEFIDATGMVVCPGFIDIQSHSIVPFLSDRRSLSKITQGVTTEIMGEAWTPSPFGGRIEDPFRES